MLFSFASCGPKQDLPQTTFLRNYNPGHSRIDGVKYVTSVTNVNLEYDFTTRILSQKANELKKSASTAGILQILYSLILSYQCTSGQDEID